MDARPPNITPAPHKGLREGTTANDHEAPAPLAASVAQRLERLEAAVLALIECQHQLLTILEEFCALHLTQHTQEQERAAALRQRFVQTQARFAARRRPRGPLPDNT